MGNDSQHVCERIREIAAPIAHALRLEVVDVFCHGRGARALVRVIIDKVGGVSIKDCEAFHRPLSRALEVDPLASPVFRLEVSSPGVDRPLKQPDDFSRSIDHLVRVKLREPLNGQWVYVGRLSEVNELGIILNLDSRSGSGSIQVSWDQINRANREVQF